MRWQALFDDLEAQLSAADAAELQSEVVDRTRREAGLIRVVDRLTTAIGEDVAVALGPAGLLRGRLVDAGVDWLLVEEIGAREVLVPLVAVLGITGLVAQTGAPGTEGEVGR